jgi:hypothetical protein
VLRFLQTKASHRLTSLQLTFLINTFACPLVFLQTLCWPVVLRCLARRHLKFAAQQSDGREPLLAGGLARVQQRAIEAAAPEHAHNGTAAAVAASASAAPEHPEASLKRQLGLVSLTTAALTTLTLSQLFSLALVEVGDPRPC